MAATKISAAHLNLPSVGFAPSESLHANGHIGSRGAEPKFVNSIYQCPEYYEIAFSFRDIRREVNVLESAAKRYARVPVRHFLELGCGNSPHMEELARRGYSYTGIDLKEMLEFSREKARKIGSSAEFVRADGGF